jgi:hypothetical protein
MPKYFSNLHGSWKSGEHREHEGEALTALPLERGECQAPVIIKKASQTTSGDLDTLVLPSLNVIACSAKNAHRIVKTE